MPTANSRLDSDRALPTRAPRLLARGLAAGLLLATAASSAGPAYNLTVDPRRGNDANCDPACETLGEALLRAGAGDRIGIEPGVLNEPNIDAFGERVLIGAKRGPGTVTLHSDEFSILGDRNTIEGIRFVDTNVIIGGDRNNFEFNQVIMENNADPVAVGVFGNFNTISSNIIFAPDTQVGLFVGPFDSNTAGNRLNRVEDNGVVAEDIGIWVRSTSGFSRNRVARNDIESRLGILGDSVLPGTNDPSTTPSRDFYQDNVALSLAITNTLSPDTTIGMGKFGGGADAFFDNSIEINSTDGTGLILDQSPSARVFNNTIVSDTGTTTPTSVGMQFIDSGRANLRGNTSWGAGTAIDIAIAEYNATQRFRLDRNNLFSETDCAFEISVGNFLTATFTAPAVVGAQNWIEPAVDDPNTNCSPDTQDVIDNGRLIRLFNPSQEPNW